MSSFKPVHDKNNLLLGHLCETTHHTYFFGSKHCDEKNLNSLFSKFAFYRVKQTHSSKIVKASAQLEEADAHWSRLENSALRISTADCMPILIGHPEFVCAIHAGWRGIRGEIIRASLTLLRDKFAKTFDQVQVIIGPYIHARSFEIGLDLGNELQRLYDSYFSADSFSGLDEGFRTQVTLTHPKPDEKVYFDLLAMAKAHMFLCGVPEDNIYDLNVNTFTSSDFASFRRDHTDGRNYSFVARRG